MTFFVVIMSFVKKCTGSSKLYNKSEWLYVSWGGCGKESEDSNAEN